MKEKSPLDNFFYELYGFYPKKSGMAYELIVGAVLKIVTGKRVETNLYKKGYSDSTYQIDGIVDANIMVEAKDYTQRNQPVDRGDIQKLQGALTDLDFDKGFFASATDYTGPAKKYAKSSISNPNQKEISLFHIRPSTKEDEKGRILQICVEITSIVPDFLNGKYKPKLTEMAEQLIIEKFTGKALRFCLDAFYTVNGLIDCTMEEWSFDNQPLQVNIDDELAVGCWLLHGKHMKLEENFFELKGIEYEIPYLRTVSSFNISSNGTHKLLVKSEDNKFNKLLTDEELRKITFD